MFSSWNELLEKSHIPIVQQTDVWNSKAQHGDSMRPHPKGPSGVALGIDPRVLEHRRMHHPAAEDFHPAGAFAGRTPGPMAQLAFHVHLRGRFGERKEGWPEADLRRRGEEPVSEM